MTQQTRAQRAIEALRKPDFSLQRVPNTVRQSLAEIIETQDLALRQFADPANWHMEPGLQQWTGMRDAISFAESVVGELTQEAVNDHVSHKD